MALAFVAVIAAGISSIIMILYARKDNSWRLLVVYSSVVTKISISLVFMKAAFDIRFFVELIIVFLLLNGGGTIIAAYFLGADR